MTTFAGREGVNTYRAIALKSGIKLYAKTKMKPNRMWTPTAMKTLAEHITGRTFKRGAWDQMIEALDAWIAAHGTTGAQ